MFKEKRFFYNKNEKLQIIEKGSEIWNQKIRKRDDFKYKMSFLQYWNYNLNFRAKDLLVSVKIVIIKHTNIYICITWCITTFIPWGRLEE